MPVIGVGHSVRFTSVSSSALSHLYFVGTARIRFGVRPGKGSRSFRAASVRSCRKSPETRRAQLAVSARFIAGTYPAISNGMTESSSSATIQRIGRMKRGAAFARPVHGFGKRRFQNELRQSLGQNVRASAGPPFCAYSCIFPPCRRRALPADPRSRPASSQSLPQLQGARSSPDPKPALRHPASRSIRPSPRTTSRRGVASVRSEAPTDVSEVAERAAQIIERARQHPVRNLFAADFEQEIHAASCAACRGKLCCSTQASATPTASFRMRPIMPTRSVTLIAPRASSVLNRLLHFST